MTVNRFSAGISRFCGGRRVVHAYWANALNFGDLLTPALLKSYGARPLWVDCCERDNPMQFDMTLVSCGSILGWVRKDFNGFVLGTGLQSENEAKVLPDAKFFGVRGALTRSRMQLDGYLNLGDPGLLVERLYKRKLVKKKWTLGIVPNQGEANAEGVRGLVSALTQEIAGSGMCCKLINPRGFPVSVIEDICACEYVVSSSLHGLVIADAFGIPNARVRLSEKIGDFKFQDYYSAYDEELSTTVVPMGGGYLTCWSRAAKCRRKGCR